MTVYYNGKKIASVRTDYEISEIEAVMEYFELDSPNGISQSDQRILKELYEMGNSFVKYDDAGTYYIDWGGMEIMKD